MVQELEGHEITIVPATVGKVVPDGTPEEEWAWVVDGLQGGLRPRRRSAA
jgi:D-psicose/D-tagatose/L-ribulose 3-epimerase